MKYSDVYINTDKVKLLNEAISKHVGDNPACRLGKYWNDRMSPRMLAQTAQSQDLQYGFVGDGWPQKSDQTKAISYDKLKLSEYYEDVDCRDIGDAIYQANKLMPYLKERSKEGKHFYIADIGSGYGRLAVPFINHLQEHLTYFGVDYSPIGLLTASQFVSQMIPNSNVLHWDNDGLNPNGNYRNYNFVSMPAWRLGELHSVDTSLKLDNYPIDLFISVHSLQEMEPETVKYYIEFMQNFAWMRPYFYSVNIGELPIPDSWELVFDRPYPVNRDGSYNEKLWIIK